MVKDNTLVIHNNGPLMGLLWLPWLQEVSSRSTNLDVLSVNQTCARKDTLRVFCCIAMNGGKQIEMKLNPGILCKLLQIKSADLAT